MQQLFTVYAENAAQQDAARWGGYFEINPVLFAGTYLIPQTLAVANQTIEPFRAAFASKLGAAASITVNITAQPSFQVRKQTGCTSYAFFVEKLFIQQVE